MFYLMNYIVKPALEIIPQEVAWGSQRALVESAMEADFMRSEVKDIEYIL